MRRARLAASNPQSAIRNPKSKKSAILVVAVFCLLAPAARGGWVEQRSGTFAWLRAVHFVDAARGWAVGGNGALLATEDGGRNWKARPRPSEDTLRDVFFADAATGWLVCERNVFALAPAEPRSYLLRTSDGGASWSRVEITSDDAGVLVARVVFADQSRGWAFGEMGALYRTQDGGRTWQRQRVPTRRLLTAAHFVDASRGWIVGTGSTVLRTTDGGETWRALSAPTDAPARLNAVHFADALRGWAVGQKGLIVATADGGMSWRAQESDTHADLTDVKFADAREGWAVGASGTVLGTTDGGRTWRQLASRTRHHLERLAHAGGARLWAVGFGGSIIAHDPAAAEGAPRITKTGN